MTTTKQEIDAAHAKIDELMQTITDASPPDELDKHLAQLKALRADLYRMLAALKASQRPH